MRAKLRLALGIVVLFAGVSVLPRPAGSQVTNPANGHGYYEVANDRIYWNARLLASFVGGTPVTITDAAEQQFVDDLVGQDLYWIGLTDEQVEGTFVWETGEPLSFAPWGVNQPSSSSSLKDYVMSLYGSWHVTFGWSSVDPKRRVVIETDAPLLPAVPGFEAEYIRGQAHLTWAAGTWDTIRIYRNEFFIATLPGSAIDYFVPTGIGGSISDRFVLIAEAGGVFTVPAEIPAYLLELGDAEGRPGLGCSTEIRFRNRGEEIDGWILAVCHDPAALQLLSLGLGDAATQVNGGPPEFETHDFHTGGFTQSVVFGGQGCCTIAPGVEDFIVAELEYMVAPGCSPGPTPLRFCETLGTPPVYTRVIGLDQYGLSGVHLGPVTVDGIVTVLDPTFLRGDVNADGGIDIADPIALEFWLFGLATEPPCREASEVNDDAQVDIADVISILSYLFIGGPAPSPGPLDPCATDPAPATSVSCDHSHPCP